MKLKYLVPFTAQSGDVNLALKEKLLNIEGEAVDTSVNANKWQVPEEDLDYFVASLTGAQLRIDHAESALAVIGRVPQAKRVGTAVWFRAEIGELPIIEKVARGYLTHVSVQVDSDDVECSKCHQPSREQGLLKHLCPGAWEIVHKPRVRELSIVASPAYQNTEFHPVGFAAAMNQSQKNIRGQTRDGYADAVRRLLNVVQKLQDLKKEDDAAAYTLLETRVTKLQRDAAKLLEEEKSLDADAGCPVAFRTPSLGEAFMQALQQLNRGGRSHMARQLDALFEAYSIADFEDYFGNPENMQLLRKLVGLA